MVVNIIEALGRLGFSENEAKAYTALLRTNPATAYETAKLSGIPTSKIYEVLARLEEKGMVLVLPEKNKRRFLPLEPGEFLEAYNSRLQDTLSGLKRDLSGLLDPANVSYIWNLKSHEGIMEKTAGLLKKARSHVLISLWTREAEILQGVLEDTVRRDIKTAVIHFGKPRISCGQIYYHPIEDTLYREKGGRGLSLVIDSKEALTATLFENGHVEGAWSANSGFVNLAEDYIKHDIYIMKIVERMDADLIRRFGSNYSLLRDVYEDKEMP